MKPILVAICTVAMAAAGQQAEAARVRPGRALLELYYNATSASIVRSFNVASVTNQSQGTYCITPTRAIDPSTVYPVANAEYLNNGWYPYAGYVAWQDTTVASDCPAGDLEVKTIYGGGPQAAISFSLLVFQ